MSSGSKRLSGGRCFEPVAWDAHFDRKETVRLPSGSFCCYARGGDSGPLLLLLHGGGFSGLSWALLSRELTSRVGCLCVAMDIRGHGDTLVDDESDFGLDTMAEEAAGIVGRISANQERPVVVVGHSMGGAVAIHLAYRRLLPALAGLVVIDVVEGSAVEALTSMQSLLSSRPRRFPSLPAAVEWCFRSGTVRNVESARVSFRGHLRPETPDDAEDTPRRLPPPTSKKVDTISEEAEEQSGESPAAPSPAAPSPLPPLPLAGPRLLAANRRQQKPPLPAVAMPTPASIATGACDGSGYTWRIDLMRTQPYWLSWFSGMSAKFLACQPAKLLLLAGVDRLDKELTVGQMQGKFQLQVLPRSGHAVHEDHPEHVAEVLAAFLVRHRLAEGGEDFRPVPPGC